MANIGLAKQYNATLVYIYDEKGAYMFSLNGVLIGYTATTVTVKHSNLIKVYNEKGYYQFSK